MAKLLSKNCSGTKLYLIAFFVFKKTNKMSSSESDSATSSVGITELDEFLMDLDNLDELLGEQICNSSNSDDDNVRRATRKRKRDRLRPFYSNRKDVLHFL